ncbi:DUF4023 family protein [Paenibacillus tarimensis]
MDTKQFVDKINEIQQKDQKNREHSGKKTPSAKLPTKQHGNNP